MFVLLFFGFDTFHAQGKMAIVCTTFAILTLSCCLFLDNKMLDLTGKVMFLKRGSTMVGTVFDAQVICCHDFVLMGQYFVR